MIYLDNAATTFPKPKEVIKATQECIKKYCANSGRSSHKAAVRTGMEIYNAREAISSFLNHAHPEYVCFTSNATYALNMAIKSTITKKCHVLISDLEHNSVLRPIAKLHRTLGVEYSVFSTDGDIASEIESKIRTETYAIVCTLMSNVTGKEIPLSLLSRVAKEHGLILITDASQIIGHKKIDLKEHPCDILCAPGHKGLFGIQGCGFAVFNKSSIGETLVEGGSGYNSRSHVMPHELPERFEAGTLATPSIVSLRVGIDFINSYSQEAIEYDLRDLTEYFKERILSIKNIELFGAENGILAFRKKDCKTSTLASILDSNNICVRDGLHCAPIIHEKIGSIDSGLIRVSLSIFNKRKEADLLYKTLKSI